MTQKPDDKRHSAEQRAIDTLPGLLAPLIPAGVSENTIARAITCITRAIVVMMPHVRFWEGKPEGIDTQRLVRGFQLMLEAMGGSMTSKETQDKQNQREMTKQLRQAIESLLSQSQNLTAAQRTEIASVMTRGLIVNLPMLGAMRGDRFSGEVMHEASENLFSADFLKALFHLKFVATREEARRDRSRDQYKSSKRNG